MVSVLSYKMILKKISSYNESGLIHGSPITISNIKYRKSRKTYTVTI